MKKAGQKKEKKYKDIMDYLREQGLLADSSYEMEQLRGKEEKVPSLEEVRELLSGIPGSLAQQIIDDRE
jgi:hypothetical protein